MKRLSILFMVMVVGFGAILLGTQIPEPNPYKYLRHDDGVAMYVFCTGKNCTLIPESEVPERFRK